MGNSMDWPFYTVSVDGVTCGHLHATVDKAQHCAENTMTRGRVPRATIYQRNQDGSRLVRRELVPVEA